jgi:alpha/beta superfamily hydrolase
VESVRFPAGPFVLEGEFAYPEDAAAPVGCAVIAGSHPLLGGNMHNNVVRGLGDGLAERGLATLRFNYRGVGQSQGPAVDLAGHMAEFWQTSRVTGEADYARDLQGAADFLREAVGPSSVTLVGYSFGCSLLPAVRLAEPPAAFVLVAPPLGKHDYEAFAEARCPVLVIASENDFTLDGVCLRAWFERLPPGKRLVQAPLDTHFFRGHEAWLAETVAAFLAAPGRPSPHPPAPSAGTADRQ